MCYIADIALPENDGQSVCGSLRIDSVNSFQRMAAVHITYRCSNECGCSNTYGYSNEYGYSNSYGGYSEYGSSNTYVSGKKYLPEHIIDKLFDQTALFPKDIVNVADILVCIMDSAPNLVSAGALYMCGTKACHITTDKEVMSVVRKGRIVKTCRKVTEKKEMFCRSVIRLKKNDTIILHGGLLYDKNTIEYVCGLISLNQKRRAARRAYKDNSEILGMICSVVGLKDGNSGSALTVITCVSDI